MEFTINAVNLAMMVSAIIIIALLAGGIVVGASAQKEINTKINYADALYAQNTSYFSNPLVYVGAYLKYLHSNMSLTENGVITINNVTVPTVWRLKTICFRLYSGNAMQTNLSIAQICANATNGLVQ